MRFVKCHNLQDAIKRFHQADIPARDKQHNQRRCKKVAYNPQRELAPSLRGPRATTLFTALTLPPSAGIAGMVQSRVTPLWQQVSNLLKILWKLQPCRHPKETPMEPSPLFCTCFLPPEFIHQRLRSSFFFSFLPFFHFFSVFFLTPRFPEIQSVQ
jgi:hypothetical protein